MKKNIILLIFIVIPILAFSQQEKYKIMGKIENLDMPAKLFLLVYSNPLNPADKVVDSIDVINGEFILTGKAKSTSKAQLLLQRYDTTATLNRISSKEDKLDFYLENETIFVKGKDSIGKALITGSKINKEYASLKSLLIPLDIEYSKKAVILRKQWLSLPDSVRKSKKLQTDHRNKGKEIKNDKMSALINFISRNPNSLVSFDALRYLTNFSGGRYNTKIDSMFNILNNEIKDTEDGREFQSWIAKSKKVNVGSLAPLFSQMDNTGHLIKLEDYRGKYTLIEFWASWCGPCRLEGPNLVNSYKRYNNKGFSIISVSLNQANERTSWLNAIKNDGTFLWKQVSDLKGWENSVAKLYSVQSIPNNFLIDPNGVIIAINLKGADLDDKLSEIFKEN